MSPDVTLQVGAELDRRGEECQTDGKQLPASLKALPVHRRESGARRTVMNVHVLTSIHYAGTCLSVCHGRVVTPPNCNTYSWNEATTFTLTLGMSLLRLAIAMADMVTLATDIGGLRRRDR